MKNTRWGLALAIAVLATSTASAAPSQNDDTGRYFDDLSDDVGVGSGSTNAALSGSGWIELVATGSPGVFTTKVISPSALSAWGKVYVKGSGTLSIRVLSSSNAVLATPTMVASDDVGFSRMADISAVAASSTPIKIEVTFAANGPSQPIVDALAVTWTPVSTLKLAASNPASLCSGATGLWKFPFSVSNVTSKGTVVTVPLGTGSLTPVFADQSTRLQFISATHGGLYHAGPGTIVVDGVTINPNTVYWRLGDVRYGTTFPLGLTAVIPNGTLNGTTYQLTATGTASNAATAVATTTLTTATATTALVIEKTLTNAYRIGDEWRAKSGSNIGYTITVRNDYASQCRATAERIVVWDPLTVAGAPYNGAPLNLVGLTYTAGAQSFHGGDAVGHAVAVPANAVYAQIPYLAPGASATFSFSMPLKTLPFDTHVINVASLDSGYTPHAGKLDAQADFYIGIDYTPHGSFAKGDSIRGAPQVSAAQDNFGLTVGYGEYFKFLLHAHNEGASILNTTTMFDKLPLGLVELVDVYVPPSANAVVKYNAGGDVNAANNPPGYNAATGVLDGSWTTNPAGAKWVAITIPRIGSSVITTNNAGAPTGVTAEIGVRTLPPSAACAEQDVVNTGYFHAAFYEPEDGVPVATNLFASNTENVTIVPKVPSFATSYAVSNPGIALASGNIRYTIGLTNRLPSAASETDSAQNVVVRVNLPKVEVAGVLSHLDLTAVQSAGGTVDYTGLPAYFDISYPLVVANSALSIDVDVYAPKGIANAAIAKLSATVSYQDIGNVCAVTANSFSASTTFDVTPFVQVDKRLDFSVAGLNRPIRYTLRSVNTGEGAAVDTVVFDRLPPELTFVRAPVPAKGQRLYFSNAVAPQLPVGVRADGDFTKNFVLSSGLFQAGVVSGGYVTSPVANPTWIAVLVDNPALTPPQLPANGVPHEVVLEMLVPNNNALLDRVLVNEANISASGLLPAVSNRPLLLISDNPALAITGACPGAIAAGENLHLVYTFTNNSTNSDDGVTARIAVPSAGLTPVAVTITLPDGEATTIPLPAGDPTRFVSVENDGTQSIVTWNVTGDINASLASGQFVKMDIEVEADPTVNTGDQLPVNVSGTATNNVPGSAVVNVGAQCTLLVSNPDIKITKLVDVASVVQGDTLTYTLVIENNGPHDADNVAISDELPAGLTFVANSVRVSPSSWAVGAPNIDGANLTWSSDFGNALVGPTGTAGFVPGLSPNIYISFKVNVGAVTAGSDVTNCAATAIGPSPSGDQLVDENTADNNDCVDVRVPNPDPRITKTGPTTVLPDATFGYTLTWSNGSRQAASNVVFFEKIPNIDGNGNPDLTLTNVLVPSGVTVYYADSPAPGNDPTAHPEFNYGGPLGEIWKATVGELNGPATWIAFVVDSLPGNSVPTSAVVNVVASDPDTGTPSAAGTNFINCVAIEMANETEDENSANNTSCVTTRVPGLNVAISKTCDPEGFFPGARPGDQTNFALQVSNLGTTPAYGIQVTDPMPSWFLIAGFSPAVATLEGGASFLDDGGNAIVGSVPWTRVGNTWVLGTNDPTDPRHFRKVAMPSGARVNLTVFGAVNTDTAAETLVTNTATVATLKIRDIDPDELASVLFDNEDSCSLTVHRPDPVVQKTADVSFAGAGDAINYTIGYDNLGLAAADQVVIEDLFPEGVDFVLGSLTDVPANAVVSYFNGTTWSTTAPIGADGTTAPGVKGIRVTFAEFEAPLAGGFRQNGLVSFDRGTYVGTAWDAAKGAVTVAPGYAGQHPTYTSPRIPTNNSGTILEWVSLIAAGTEGVELPAIDVLDGETGAVIMTADALSEDLRSIDTNLHPTLQLRAKFSAAMAGDYSGAIVPVGKPLLSGEAQALKTAGNFIAGLTVGGEDSQPLLWERVGNDYEAVALDTEGVSADMVTYFDGSILVVGPYAGNPGDVTVYTLQSDMSWLRTDLASGAQHFEVAPLTGANAALCGSGPCYFAAWRNFSGGLVSIAYTSPSGWLEVPTGLEGRVASINELGYVVAQVNFPSDAGTVFVPTGTDWQMSVLPQFGASFYFTPVLAGDAAEILISTHSGSPTRQLHRLIDEDGEGWVAHDMGTTYGEVLSSVDGTFIFSGGYDVVQRVDGELTITASLSDRLPVPFDLPDPRATSVGPDGMLVGYAGPYYAPSPVFWSWDGAEYHFQIPSIDGAYFFEPYPQGVSGDGSVAWGTAYYEYVGLAFVNGGEGWSGQAFDAPTYRDVAVNDGSSQIGWVGSTSDSYEDFKATVWPIDEYGDGLTGHVLESPLAPVDATILGGLPGGCMVGRADSGETVGWVKDLDGTYAPVSFTNWEDYSDIHFVVETPEHRIFGNAWDGDNNVSVEFNCTDEGLTLSPVARANGVIPTDGSIVAYRDGALIAYDYQHQGWWTTDAQGTLIYFSANGPNYSLNYDRPRNEDGVFFDEGYDYNSGLDGVFATIAVPAGDSDLTFQWLPLPDGAESPKLVDYVEGHLLGSYYLGSDAYTAVWSQATPASEWVLLSSTPNYYPVAFAGDGATAQALVMPVMAELGDTYAMPLTLTSSTLLHGLDTQDLRGDIGIYGWPSQAIHDAYEAGVIADAGYSFGAGDSFVHARNTAGDWVGTSFTSYDQYRFLGQVQPGVFLGIDNAGLYLHRVQPDGTLSTAPINLGGAILPANFFARDLGPISDDGTFMIWMKPDEGSDLYESYAFYPNGNGYAVRNLGLQGDQPTYIDNYQDVVSFAPGIYLGNGCWTLPFYDGTPNSEYFTNGVDPSGDTTNLRLWGCSVAGDSEELASWEVAYRGDVTPTIGYRTIIEKQCQNQIANTAEISTTTPEVTASNNTSTATTSVANADIAVNVTAPALVIDAAANPNFDLTVTVTNNGPNAGKNVVADLALPAGLTPAAPFTWTIASLAVGASQTFVVPVSFVSNAADVTYNVAASSTAASIDCVTDNDAITLSLLTGDHPDIRVTKSGPASVRAFESFTYDVSWQNVGNVVATDFTVTDYLPPTSPELTVVDYGEGYLDTGVVNWDVATLGIGETVTDRIVVEVDSCDLVGRTLVNTLRAPYLDDANPLDNEAAATTLVLPPAAALSVELVSSRTMVVAGETLQLTAYYRNTGDATVIAGELSFDIADWNVETSSVIGGYLAGGAVNYALGNIAPGGYGSVTFAISGPGPGADDFSVTASGSNACPVSATVGASLKGTAINIVKSVSSDNACTNEAVTWSIVVSNPGTAPVDGVEVSDSIAAGATYVSGSATPGASVSGATLTWAIGSIPAHGSVVLSYATTLTLVDATYVGSAPAWSTSETTGVANTTAVRVECDNALEVDKAMSVTCVDGDPVVSVTLSYNNSGSATIEDLVVSDYLGGLQAISSDPAAVDGVVTFDRATLPGGASGTFTFTAILAAEPGTIVTNRATIEAAGDFTLTSNQAAVAVPECEQAECDDNADCEDDNVCTDDLCDGGTCVNTTVSCNDFNACTNDSCESQTGCQNTAVDCDDGDLCTDDECNPATGCTNTDVPCDDQDNCTNDSCDPLTGQCSSVAVDCNDSNPCTADSCADGVCVNALNSCNDNNPCTTDSCNAQTGACVNTATTCDDNSVCTTDSCNPSTGQCEFTTLPCAADDACHTAACDPVAGCVETAIDCNDNSLCTANSCNPITGCQVTTVSCDDFNPCTADSCDPGTGCANTAIVCNDNNACTNDSCDPGVGCVYAPVTCNDGDACTTDSCDTQLGCETAPITCNDNNACTDNTCDPGTGCAYPTIACNDNSLCTTDSCDPAIGCSFDTIECDDDNACTIDFCDAALGCQTADVDCSDGNACTTDQCDPLIGCQHPDLTCDDGNACTADSCDIDTGCSNAPLACDDGNPCTADSCDPLGGGCVNTPMTCDDNDICTTDSCSDTLGCQNVPVEQRPIECGAGACSGVVEGVESCIDNQWVNNCDELPTGEIPDSGCGELRVAYAIVNDASGQPYGTIRCYQDTDNHVIGCETVPGSTTELRIYEAFFCGEE